MQLTNTVSDSNIHASDDIELTDSTQADIIANDTVDNISDTDQIDLDLTSTYVTSNDTISEAASNNVSNADHTDSIARANSQPESPTSKDDIYNFIEQRLLSLDPVTTMALGNLNYYEHFFPHYMAPEKEGGFGKTLYKRSPPRASDSDSEDVDADELGLVFFGEVCSSTYGTAITAKGNHYGGTRENPKVRTILLKFYTRC